MAKIPIAPIGENAPANWEKPLGSKDVHLVVAALARDTALMETLVMGAQDAVRDLPGITPIWDLDVHVPPDGREQFGFKDSISQPAIEGTGILGSNPHEAPLKPGEFVLGYKDETGSLSQVPQPEALGRNGTYVAFRKLHQQLQCFVGHTVLGVVEEDAFGLRRETRASCRVSLEKFA